MFLHRLVEFGGCSLPICELNHHWRGINVLSILECCLLAALLCSVLALGARYVRRSRRLTTLAIVGALSFATAAYAANTALSALSASGAIAGANLIYVVQTVGVGGVKATMTQVATFINSLFSGDATVTSGGVVTLKNTGPGATGPLGSATVAPIVTIDAQGRVTALSSATVTPAVGNVTGLAAGIASWLATPSSANLAAALTDETGSGPAVFGTAPTIANLNATTALTLAFLTGSTQCLQVNTSGVVSGTGAVCGAAPSVTSRTVTGATDTILAADRGNVVFYNSAVPVAVAQPAPTGSFAAGFFTTLCDINAGVATITPGSGTIGGGVTYPLPGGTVLHPVCIDYQSDGTNFNAVNAGNTSTIGSGTAVLGTSAIASGACATAVTVSAPNTLTTDRVKFSYNGDPTAVTGYGVSATGAVLTIYPYPTANNVNVKVCNSSAGSITPGALTLNWDVQR